jgi:hypothetical protein
MNMQDGRKVSGWPTTYCINDTLLEQGLSGQITEKMPRDIEHLEYPTDNIQKKACNGRVERRSKRLRLTCGRS